MVFVIDGNHLASRCWFTIMYDKVGLTTPEGKQVGTIYLFSSLLRNLIKKYKSNDTYFYITWDGGGKTFRHELYPNYKGDRTKFAPEFYEQIIELQQLLEHFDVTQYREKGVEADDFIGTICNLSRKNKQKVIIYSGDHDFEQLISNSINVVKHEKNGDLTKDIEWFENNYEGLKKPCDLIDLMALTGDSSDNVSGIPKVGDVTGIKLLIANNGLDNLLQNIDNLKTLDKNKNIVDASDKLKQSVKDNIDNIKLNRKLVKINQDLDIEFKLLRKGYDFNEILKSFKKYNFKSYIKEFDLWKKDLKIIQEN